ncbi:MAG TPA: type II toxin-antitoxin system VapC family toxin [Steroidobacteraceae bacterium]|nr:type II toxin-antitoxin system VapC family toxin [Steroidobacteraceae bacterium]
MTNWLLDTNVVSELRRPRPDRNVLAFVAAQPLERLFISTVTLAEIRFGIERLPDPVARAGFTTWLTHQVRPMFEHRVLPLSEDVLFRWRVTVAEGRSAGITYPQPDLFIAATALHYGMTVATRDTTGFARTGVSMLDPWQNPLG